MRRHAASPALFLLAVLGLITGLFIYVFILLNQPLRALISIAGPDSLKPVPLDGVSITQETGEIIPWGQGGRTRVYVHPDIPIKKVARKDPGVETILIFCEESRAAADSACRADSLILLTFDRTARQIKLTSVMCDIQAEIAGLTGKARLSDAYAYGGAGLLVNTLNDTLDLDIQHFAFLDFWNGGALVDLAGGIQLEIAKADLPAMNHCLAEQNAAAANEDRSPLMTKAGTQAVDERQAIAWARIRKLDGDFERAGRQRTVLLAAIRKLVQSGAGGLISLMNSGLGSFETNLGATEMVRLAADVLRSTGSIREFHVPSRETMYTVNDDPFSLVVDWEKQQPELRAFIWGTP